MEKVSSRKCFYGILGLKKESSAEDIRTSYRKLAMKWHPDRCSKMTGDAREDAKLRFQEIQEAYDVLSHHNRRFLYDAGLHGEFDGDYGMQDFIGELVNLMNNECCASNAQSSENDVEEMMKLFPGFFDVIPNGQEAKLANPMWRTAQMQTPR